MDQSVTFILGKCLQLRVTQYNNAAKYAKLWHYILGMQAIAEAYGILAFVRQGPAIVTLIGTQASGPASILQRHIANGDFCLVETKHRKHTQLVMLYLIECTTFVLKGEGNNKWGSTW